MTLSLDSAKRRDRADAPARKRAPPWCAGRSARVVHKPTEAQKRKDIEMSRRRVPFARCAALLLPALLSVSVLSAAPAHASGEVCPDETLASQPATMPGGDWKAYVSEQFNLVALGEDFRVERDIGSIRWWGFLIPRNGAPNPEINLKQFKITIFANGIGNLPGIVEQSQETVIAPVATGEVYDGHPLWSFTAVLDTPCTLRAGWIVIQGSEDTPSAIFQWITSDTGNDASARSLWFSQWEWIEGDDLSLCLTPVPRREDVNADGVIDLLDLLLVLAAWGPAPAPCPPYPAEDVNMDGSIDALDVLEVLSAWGPLP
jgi:hypothetical protein